MANGTLEKMTIFAYSNPELSGKEEGKFTAMINPENYTLDYKVELTKTTGIGNTAGQQAYILSKPGETSFEFLFDNTGIIDNKKDRDIFTEIQELKKLLIDLHGESHEPFHLKIVWGNLLLKVRCTSLNIAYKLFNPDGSPIRAICKASFKDSKDEKLRVAEEKKKSPDLTHYRVVKKGDTLPLMCYKIYGDAKYYLQIAQVNQLNNFRNLIPGTGIYFPPLI